MNEHNEGRGGGGGEGLCDVPHGYSAEGEEHYVVAPAIKTVEGVYVRNIISGTGNANRLEDPSTVIGLSRSLYQWF